MILLAAAAALSFSPPVGQPVTYETEQVRTVDGAAQRYRMVNRLVFARDGAGWRATLTLVDLSTDARPDLAVLFDTGMRPFRDVEVLLWLDSGGHPTAVIDGATAWAKVTASLRALAEQVAARSGGGGTAADAVRGWAGEMATLPPEARDARLMAAADALLGFELPPIRVGASVPWRDAGGTGTITALPGGRYRIATTAGSEAGALADETAFALDLATGLLASSRSVKRLNGRVLAEETIRRLP